MLKFLSAFLQAFTCDSSWLWFIHQFWYCRLFAMCIKLAVLSSFSWSWSSCSHHCSISDDLEWFWVLPAPLVGHKASYGCYAPDHLLPARAWSHQIGCRGIGLLHSPDLATSLGLKCRAEPGVHHFHTLQFRVRWRELLKDCQVLHMEKKQVKAWIVQEVTVMKSQRSYCMTRKRCESDCLV